MGRPKNEWNYLTQNTFSALLDNEESSVTDRFAARTIRRYRNGTRAPSATDQFVLLNEVSDFATIGKRMIRKRIRDFLNMTGSTSADLAKQLGVSTSTVDRWISGESVPRRSNREQLKSIFIKID